MSLTVLALNCTLKAGSRQSSTAKLLHEVMTEFSRLGVDGEVLRIADFDVKPGVSPNEGKGDDWPQIRKRLLKADILIVGTPIWMGHLSSHAQRLCERMQSFLDQTDRQDRMPTYGKVACVAVVGNEDGAHHVSADLFQALNDLGFTIPATAVTYWVGEAMGDKNYVDVKASPREVTRATQRMVSAAIHAATLFKDSPYPGRHQKI